MNAFVHRALRTFPLPLAGLWIGFGMTGCATPPPPSRPETMEPEPAAVPAEPHEQPIPAAPENPRATDPVSPDGQWEISHDFSLHPPYRKLRVAHRATGQQAVALRTMPGEPFRTLWSFPPAPTLLLITVPGRRSRCYVHDPYAETTWRVDEAALRDMDERLPEPFDTRHVRGRALAPDGQHLLLDVAASVRRARFQHLYVVETRSGAIVRTFRHEHQVPQTWWTEP